MKNVIVTGAGKGLGQAITAELIAKGYFVHAVDRDDALLTKLKLQFASLVEVHTLDVSRETEVENLFSSLKNVSLFALVSNAGVYLGKSLLDYSSEEVAQVLNVNLGGAINFSKHFGAKLLSEKSEGVIVNLSSSSVYGGGDAVYSASKAGLIGLTKSCALKFSPYIRVNAVAPGIVETDILKTIPPEVIQRYRSNELVKKPLVATDVAQTVCFLLSEEAKNYSGAVFDLNNGFHL